MNDVLYLGVEEALFGEGFADCDGKWSANVRRLSPRMKNERTKLAVDERAVELHQAASAKVVEFVAMSETAGSRGGVSEGSPASNGKDILHGERRDGLRLVGVIDFVLGVEGVEGFLSDLREKRPAKRTA